MRMLNLPRVALVLGLFVATVMVLHWVVGESWSEAIGDATSDVISVMLGVVAALMISRTTCGFDRVTDRAEKFMNEHDKKRRAEES